MSTRKELDSLDNDGQIAAIIRLNIGWYLDTLWLKESTRPSRRIYG